MSNGYGKQQLSEFEKSRGQYIDSSGNPRGPLKEGLKSERQTGDWRRDAAEGKVYPHDIADISSGGEYYKIRNLIQGKKEGHKNYHFDTGRPGLSQRDQALGSDLLRNVTKKLSPDKVDEFYDKLKTMESTYDVYFENRDEYKPYYAAEKSMKSFLKANVGIEGYPKESTAEDKIMNGFLQQDNKYIMGE